jgi:hypothetical protein
MPKWGLPRVFDAVDGARPETTTDQLMSEMVSLRSEPDLVKRIRDDPARIR